MAMYKIVNLTEQWLVLNNLNTKISPKSLSSKELIVDEAQLDNPDIKELVNSKKIAIVKPAAAAPAKRGRKKKVVDEQKNAEEPNSSEATVVNEGVPARKKFTNYSANQNILVDEHEYPDVISADEAKNAPPDVVTETNPSSFIDRKKS